MSGGTRPRETPGSLPPSIASTRSGVGGTTGRPSVQPRSNISSMPSVPAGADIAAASSGSIAALEEHPGLSSGSVASGAASPAPRSAPGLLDEGRQGRVVPAGHGARDRPGAVDENRRRHRDQPVGAGRLVRRVLGGDPARPAETAGHPDGDLERVLEDGGGAEPGLLPCRAQRAEPAQGHRGGGAILVDEQQERGAARGEGADGDLAEAGPADGQRGRRMRAGGAVVAAGHMPALPQPPRSAEGLGRRVIPRAPAPGKDVSRARPARGVDVTALLEVRPWCLSSTVQTPPGRVTHRWCAGEFWIMPADAADLPACAASQHRWQAGSGGRAW